VYRFQDGRYLVATRGSDALYFFSADGTSKDRRLMPEVPVSVSITSEDNIVAQGGGSPVDIFGFTKQGAPLWGRSIIGEGKTCCTSHWAVKVLALQQGGVVGLANSREAVKPIWSDQYFMGTMYELNEHGGFQ